MQITMFISILGDGELEEGQVWEAAMFAGHYKLNNLTAFVDFNGLKLMEILLKFFLHCLFLRNLKLLTGMLLK